MKPFNLEAARAGAPLVTRDGRKARVGIWDANRDYPLVGLIELGGNEGEGLASWTLAGEMYKDRSNAGDLFMASVKKEGWVRIGGFASSKPTPGCVIYDNPEAAESPGCIVGHLEWEE